MSPRKYYSFTTVHPSGMPLPPLRYQVASLLLTNVPVEETPQSHQTNIFIQSLRHCPYKPVKSKAAGEIPKNALIQSGGIEIPEQGACLSICKCMVEVLKVVSACSRNSMKLVVWK